MAALTARSMPPTLAQTGHPSVLRPMFVETELLTRLMNNVMTGTTILGMAVILSVPLNQGMTVVPIRILLSLSLITSAQQSLPPYVEMESERLVKPVMTTTMLMETDVLRLAP